MSLAIDYLPEAYRARVARSRDRRERLLLAIPLLAALFGTDWILRQRVKIVAQLATQATARAMQGEQRAEQTRQLGQRVAAAKTQVENWVEPLAAPRMTELLDELLAERPDSLVIQELACRHEPWSTEKTSMGAPPMIRMVASCDSPATFTAYTTALQAAGALPRLICQRTFNVGDDKLFGFHLESTTDAGVIR